CARRKVVMRGTASGIVSDGSFHGYRLAGAFGARCPVAIATAYGCDGTSSGRTRIGVWQARTNSRVTVYTKSARARYILVRKVSTIAIVMSGRRADSPGPPPRTLLGGGWAGFSGGAAAGLLRQAR